MTISHKAYMGHDDLLERPKIEGIWNSDGSLLICSYVDGEDWRTWGLSSRSIHIMPFELNKILKVKDAKVGDTLYEKDLVRPALCPTRSTFILVRLMKT